MAVGFPTKANWAAGDVLTASQMDDLAGTVNTVQYLKPWNQVLNSNFSVWQRGTSFTSGAWQYTADCWKYDRGLNGSGGTLSRVASSVTGIQYAARMARTAGDTNTNGFELASAFETVNSIPFAGKQVTFSFYAVAGANFSSSSNQLQAILYSGTGTDQSPTNMYAWTGTNPVISVYATLTTTVQRFTYTATVPANATQLGIYFYRGATGTAGAADYCDITGIQLEQGSVANTYQPNQSTFQGELAACQYYYKRWTGNSIYSYLAAGSYGSTTRMDCYIPIQMRTVPSAVDYSTLTTYDGNNFAALSAITVGNGGQNYVKLDVTVSGGTQYRPTYLTTNNNAAGYLGLSAEL